MTEFNRVLGQLESGFAAMQKSMERLHDGQERQRIEAEESRRRLHERIEKYEEESGDCFRLMRESIDALAGRISRLEPVEDAMESHGAALLDLEKRMADFEGAKKMDRNTRQTNKRWIKALLAGVVTLAGDHLTGGRFFKWIGSMFKQ